MWPFHRHTWAEQSRTVVPPMELTQFLTAYYNLSQHQTEALLCGRTTIVFQCSDPKCRTIQKVECLGQAPTSDSPWPELAKYQKKG